MQKSIAVFLVAAIVAFVADAQAVTIHWSYVASKGSANVADGTGFGAVGYAYSIGTYDVTNSQYVEFLNAKDATGADTLGLYNSNMSNGTYGGINFNGGNANGMKYSVISGNGNHPLNYATWYDSLRFANWLSNGQGNGDTENGAYTLLGGTPTPSNASTITRNAGATVFLPSENEWYKAAYYNPATSSYYQYPTSSNTAPTAEAPPGGSNSANYNGALGGQFGNLTDVGAYSRTTSPYGAFDMGGNVYQWNEGFVATSFAGARGGSFDSNSGSLQSSTRFGYPPASEFFDTGFRVASTIPEPSTGVLAILGFASLAALGWRRRKRSD
jgi:formylglycine-generating enzyme required for sulfatase activity